MFSTIRDNLSARHLGLVGYCLLAFGFMALFRYDQYGIEEGAALDLILNWSIVQQIASPVGFFGVPDLRAILFIPLDMHWVGSLAAAKVYTMFFLFGTSLLLYRWSESLHGSEASMIATALLLISPVALMQVDAIGAGVYLLWAYAVATVLDDLIHASERSAPSWLFLQILICAFAVSLHPMGLALPAALLWRWVREHDLIGKRRRMMLTLLITTAVILLLRWGWYGVDAAAANPLTVLADLLIGSPLLHAESWGVGLIVADLGAAAMIATLLIRKLDLDVTTVMLMLASLIGVVQADHAWALIFWAMTLYLGMPLLIRLNERIGWRGVAGQRGLVLLVAMVIIVMATMAAKNSYATRQMEMKNHVDQLIAVAEREAAHAPVDEFVIASQWPARTLLATRRDVLPLPPHMTDIAEFESKIEGVTHLIFDPQAKSQHQLAQNMAALSHKYETIALMPAGVVLKHKSSGNSVGK